MEEYIHILKNEFSDKGNSFFINLRGYFMWDKEAFHRLTEAMKACCIDMESKETLPRWLCWLFYYLSHSVKDFTTKGNYRKEHSQEYYEKAYRRLDDLESWFFKGRSPYMNGVGFDPMEK